MKRISFSKKDCQNRHLHKTLPIRLTISVKIKKGKNLQARISRPVLKGARELITRWDARVQMNDDNTLDMYIRSWNWEHLQAISHWIKLNIRICKSQNFSQLKVQYYARVILHYSVMKPFFEIVSIHYQMKGFLKTSTMNKTAIVSHLKYMKWEIHGRMPA